MDWEESWAFFIDKWNLDDEIRKIDHYLDFSFYADDISLYVRSPNEKKEFHGSGGNGDAVLNTIVKYDMECESYCEISNAIEKLDVEHQKLFYQIFKMNTHIDSGNEFLKEDLIVSIAEADSDYIFGDVIRNEFEALKEDYLNRLNILVSNQRENISDLVERYHSLIHPRWSTDFNVVHGNTCYQRNLFILGTLYKEEKISFSDFERMLLSMRSGRSYLKYIEKIA